VNDVIAAEFLQLFRSVYRIRHRHVVAHDLSTEIAACAYHKLDCLGMSLSHHHEQTSPGLHHDFSFEPAAVHCLEIGDNRYARVAITQLPYRSHALGNDKRGAHFEPIDAGADAYLGCMKRFA